MRVYVHILVWNDRRYLPELFKSLENQTYKNFTVRILDNGSTDDTLDYLRQNFPHTLVARNTKNAGFAEGHNQLIRFTLNHLNDDQESAIIIMNPDVILDSQMIEKMIKGLRSEDCDIVQPKAYRAFGENIGDEYLEQIVKSDVIDTTGLSVSRSWRMTDRGAGEIDEGQYDEQNIIFGPCGAAFLLKLNTVKDVMIGNDFFDSDFFTYREDCDLAWRLQKLGYKTRLIPDAILYHYRGMYGAEKQTLLERLKNRKAQSPFFAALSTRNQIFVLIKNLTILDFILSMPWILIGEGVRLFYGFIFESQTRGRLIGILGYIPKMLRKRRKILKSQKVSERELRAYIL